MPSRFDQKQKSLTRRFLLVLGIMVFVCVTAMGLLVMFGQLDLNLSATQRYTVGGLFIAYGIIRFVRIFRKSPDDEKV
jgi:hypothetical protein